MSDLDSSPRGEFTTRSGALEPFLAMEILERATEMEREGIDIAHLEVGEPEFAPPSAATQAAQDALARGETGYTDSRGLWALREAIAENIKRRFNKSVSPDQILVTLGTSSAMTLTFACLAEPGDEVLIPTPHYPCYPNFVRFCGAEPVFVPTDAASGWQVDPDRVRAAITPRTRSIVVASPANPTGAVQSREVMEALAGLGPTLISDEIYDGLVYDDVKTTSAHTVSDDAFVLDGFSKRYAMTGFRLGWLVAPQRAMRRLQTLQQNLFISASSFVQYAGIAALESGGEMAGDMRAACASRRRFFVDGLRRLGFGIEKDPDGAFYVLADARAFSQDSRALAFELLEEARVGVTPGIDFGEAAEGRLRFCYALSEATLEKALARMEPVLAERTKNGSSERGGVAQGNRA